MLKLKILEQSLFLNGHLFSLSEEVRSEAGDWEKDGIVFHYSWTGTKQEKFDKLEKYGFKYLDFKGIFESQPILKPKTRIIKPGKVKEIQVDNHNTINVIIYFSDKSTLDFVCDKNSSMFEILFRENHLSNLFPNRNLVVSLLLDEEDQQSEFMLETSNIENILVHPPLSPQVVSRLCPTRSRIYFSYLKRSAVNLVRKIGKLLF